ncbi:SWIM zinc finger family protein [Micromonospora echinofusca]|uniref:SWIM zinc finger n=1 Tax=Micromonospora echinofusca TaxID=47858 RepID=A0A1C5GA23_MICEH|nr:SWIM zinc finger family protein [Micromonospora echinofusca]SCG16729.1 SWIM zinc finger [Micromonospora echinofusca]
MTQRTATTVDTDRLPAVLPAVAAAAVAALPSRLHKRLDAAVERLAGVPVGPLDGGVSVDCGPEALVTLTPGPAGAVTDPDQARCSCLLSPRCLHRTAVLLACPVADPGSHPGPPTTAAASPTPDRADAASGRTGRTRKSAGAAPTKAQRAAADALWRAGAAVLSAGVPAAGAVPQAELLRAAHGARLAGLPRAESAALRTVRGLRAQRGRQNGHRLAELVEVLHDLLYVAGRLAAGDPDPALVGVLRRAYQPDGTLEVHGVCREPVISATGYAGVVTHLLAADGRQLSFGDVKPGGPDRARDCARAVTEMGAVSVNHAVLSRGGLRITGTTVSPDGRLGAGKGVRATPLAGTDWATGALAELFARPLAEVVTAQLATEDPEDPGRAGTALVGGDLVVVGAVGDQVLARELAPATDAAAERAPVPDGPLIRLVPVDAHPGLAHVANLRRLASRPGLRVRVVGRLDPDRASTLRPLAVGPVPGAAATLRLPPDWHGRADLGYDEIQGGHLPPRDPAATTGPVLAVGADAVAESPLWRVRRLVELAVAGGRRAVAEAARGDGAGPAGPLRRAGFTTAAALAAALADESDRRGRDAFGRLTDPDPDRYAWAWLAATVHLAAAERELIRSSWTASAVG